MFGNTGQTLLRSYITPWPLVLVTPMSGSGHWSLVIIKGCKVHSRLCHSLLTLTDVWAGVNSGLGTLGTEPHH